ncbi:MAG: (d)CMP kinase [Methanomassiliicoccales archaeon]
MRVTISGPPGSGKTTVCERLSEMLSVECVISGNVFREMARNHDLTLEQFGHLAEQDPQYDKMLDRRMVEIARGSEDIIMEGRLAGHMLARHGIPAFKVLLEADLEERARRVAEREGIDPEKAKEQIDAREESERTRYWQYYGIDLLDREVYDLILDTTDLSPERVADLILERLGDVD